MFTVVTPISDSGHGWFKVSLEDFRIAQVANEISSYSYVDDKYIYLEEDCDFDVFHLACDRIGLKINWMPDVYHVGDSPIRQMRRYLAPVSKEKIKITITETRRFGFK
jgi:hypothetical protein